MPSPADRGAQPERTLLAWRRSALAVAVNGGLLIKAGAGHGPLALAPGLAVLAVAVVCWVLPTLRYRRRAPAEGWLVGPLGRRIAVAVAVAIGVVDAVAVLV